MAHRSKVGECGLILAILMAAPFAVAQNQGNAGQGLTALKTARAAAQAAYKTNLIKYKGNRDILVRPGLLADRKARRITVWGAAISLFKGDPIEFFLIPANSGKDYEALAVAFIRPSHLDEALRFIGMKPGRGVNFSLLRFWPKGERVIVTVDWDEPPAGGDGKTKRRRVRIERLVLNKRTGRALPAIGLVYSGSYWWKDPKSGRRVFAADVCDSKSIASTYNEPSTVLDVPFRARQGDVYDLFRGNPAYRFGKYQRIVLTIEPEYKDGKRRVRDLVLTARARSGRLARSLKDIAFSVADSDGSGIDAGDDSLAGVLAGLAKVVENGQDPFVSIRFGPRLSLQVVRQLCTLLAAVQAAGGMRIEPPPEGQLFFEAFLPPDNLRDRKQRVFQPWELHLAEDDGKIDATLIDIREDWKLDTAPKISEKRYSIRGADQLAALLKKKTARRRRELLVYAPLEMSYGTLVSLLRPALDERPTVYIFLPKTPPKTPKAKNGG